VLDDVVAINFDGARCHPQLNQHATTNLLNICTISLPRFDEQIAQVTETDPDLHKFIWILAYLGKTKYRAKLIPDWVTTNPCFQQIIAAFELERMTAREFEHYERLLFAEYDRHDQYLTAYEEGFTIGQYESLSKVNGPDIAYIYLTLRDDSARQILDEYLKNSKQ
jgi:hypothetical protein